MLIFFLGTLFATCLAVPGPVLSAPQGFAYAVDVDKALPPSFFECVKRAGYSAVFTRVYDPTGAGRFDSNAVNNIRNAKKAGLETEVFMTPNARSLKNGKKQFTELYRGLKKQKIEVKTVWLQVSSSMNWKNSTRANIAFLKDILDKAKSYDVTIGFYTNAYAWSKIANGAWVQNPLLWYCKVNGEGSSGETEANFSDFEPFGNFVEPRVKQFGKMVEVCGVTVNKNIYTLNQSMHFLAPSAEEHELVVGSFSNGAFPNLLTAE
ncbi:hypothetical protein NECAME_16968 [Necator americanus]|uniref:Lysozyme n=1 Tax=Necator americanus TaxID=51031 RepID=W2TUY6_NECAM|nr:hypothetical protein NECAME_16968 [Necator americanus]ETN84876.1 hypothetical protein NECAME_16968 [Necator americanus]